jgi:predicted phosphodiesterase
MKIKLISDVHHEFFEDIDLYKNNEQADVLVIAGDLAVGHDACWYALKEFAEEHEHVVYVPGNHEYYRGQIEVFDDYISRFSTGSRIHFMNPGMIKIKDVTFFGGTLWTNFRDNVFSQQAAARGISDFSLIRNFPTTKASELYGKHIKYIKDAYAAVEGKKVIVTHFLPAIECISPQYKGNSAINDYFANDLGPWMGDLKDVPYFLFGHTHDPIDLMIGDVRMISNPYGYGKRTGYVPKILEV